MPCACHATALAASIASGVLQAKPGCQLLDLQAYKLVLVRLEQPLRMCAPQVQSAQTAIQQCSSKSASCSYLGMRWYLPEAPLINSPIHMLPGLHSKHQSFPATPSAATEPQLPQQSGSCHPSTAFGNVAGEALQHLHCMKSWSTGTFLRVLLSFMLLCGYVIILSSGF